MINPFRSKQPYSQLEVTNQLGILSELNKYRDKALQAATLNRSNVKQQHYLEEVSRYDVAIEVAQEVLQFMLEAITKFNKRKG